MSHAPIRIDGQTHALGKRIGKGGEGEVFTLDGRSDSAVKIYKPELRANREPKVRAMIASKLAQATQLVAFPSAVATDSKGGFLGFLMRLVSGYRPLHELYSPKSRRLHFPKADYRFLVRAALNVANAVGKVHQTGCVIGDLNHSGVLVANDATVALIDADSFQYTSGSKSFACVVGVPDFTPPELHGADLARTARTQAHDNFGLAVAIFHLLAMGRHPYAGRFAGGDISMSEAIAQNRFAFSNARSSETRTVPPPGTISLADFPQPLASAFEAAFGRDPRARPGAGTWTVLLKELEAALSHCSQVRTHYFPSAAGSCVWCRISAQSGVEMFPDLSAAPQTAFVGNFDLDRVLTQFKAIKLPAASELIPGWTGTITTISEAAAAAKRAVAVRKLTGVIAIAGAAVGFSYAAAAAILWIGIGIFGLIRVFGEAAQQSSFSKAYTDADARVRSLEAAFINRIGLTELQTVQSDVERTVADYRQLDSDLARELSRLKSTREARQLEAFLDRFSIRRASLPGIGPAKTATLASYGIETAADVKARAVMAVPGVGEALTAKLLAWRRGHEVKFRYNPNASDVQAENAIRANAAAKRNDLQKKIVSGISALQAAPQNLTQRARIGDPALAKAQVERAQALHDLQTLGMQVPALPRAQPITTSPTQPASKAPRSPAAASGAMTCPQCNAPMVRRTARKGYRRGNQFWGCSRYPACRGTRN